MKITDEMVNRFLSWPLPASVCSDPVAHDPGAPHRTGTNLLTATEARAMLEHVIGGGVTVDLASYNALSVLHGEKFKLACELFQALKNGDTMTAQRIEAFEQRVYGKGRPVPPHRSGGGSPSLSGRDGNAR